MIKEEWGKTKSGEQVYRYILKNSAGMEVVVINYGAVINSVKIPDKDGIVKDIVLGYDTIEAYEKGDSCFGALVGRNANRISNAKCIIEGVEYNLEENQPGYNLHSGSNNLTVQVWKDEGAEVLCKEDLQKDDIIEDAVVLHYFSEDMDEGLPGNMKLAVSYSLTKHNALVIEYFAETDKTTIVNITNHSYFNLAGHKYGRLDNQCLSIKAEKYLPISEGDFIPTGIFENVDNTPMDFRVSKPILQDIEADYKQVRLTNGYDHCFVLDESDAIGDVKLAAEADCSDTGISMSVYTNCPAVQLYTANGLNNEAGKDGSVYNGLGAFCLETEVFPDSVNQENFKKPLLHPGEKYYSMTAYEFQVKNKME